MSNDTTALQEQVKDLAERLKESVDFYRTAAKNAINPQLKQLFEARMRQRQEFIEDLNAYTWVDVESKVEEHEGVLESVRRGMMTVKAAMTIERDKTDQVVLEESQEEESRLLDAYREVLQEEALPATLHDQLETQFNQIQAAYAYVATFFTTSDMPVVLALFADVSDVQTAVNRLADHGIQREEIGLVSREDVVSAALEEEENLQITRESSGATMLGGSVVGGLIGLAAGATVAIVMGVGAVTVVGLPASLAVAAAGSGIGATYGGIFGALIGWGVAEDDTQRYIEGVREGQVLLAVRVPAERTEEIGAVLRQANGRDVAVRQQEFDEVFEDAEARRS